MVYDVTYCTKCEAVTEHEDGLCNLCYEPNIVYDNTFDDPNVIAFRRDRDMIVGEEQ